VNRKGCYVPQDDIIAKVFSSAHIAYRLKQVRRCSVPMCGLVLGEEGEGV
jgi:hypothetical protein